MSKENNDIKERIRSSAARAKIMSADEAAAMIKNGMTVGVSGFTPSGYPKAVPLALKTLLADAPDFKINLYSGASLGPEIDTEFAKMGIIEKRLPYQTNSLLRKQINSGIVEYVDMHLSQTSQYINYHTLEDIDIAIIEAIAITENGDIVPTTSIGNSPAFVKNARKVIVEINLSKPLELEGLADIASVANPPERKPINIYHPSDRIGTPYIECGLNKISAIVFTDLKDKTRPFSDIDDTSGKISDNILKFFRREVAQGRLPENLLPIQSGVGNVANAVLYGLSDSEYTGLTFYTEVVQDSMLALLRSGKASVASTTALSPSPKELERFMTEIDFFKDKLILRPQEISNNPEVIRRLGVIAMNTAVEIDIYGNVNSSHIMGSEMINGIGGSGDFSRNAAITIFSTASTAKEGKISTIVPMVSHTDHTEHDVMIVVTEQGFADLRGLSPKERAFQIINNCAHPDYKDALLDYYRRACESSALHTPHLLSEALSWHDNYLKTGSMKK